MSPARKTFVWIATIGLLIGALVGVIELVAPDMVSVSLNGTDMSGFLGLVVATASGLVAGVILGLMIGAIVKLVTRGRGGGPAGQGRPGA